ncbi:anti-sigma factor antagonist [Mycobacterium montefiorense]|uniref:Anti-sigma factor antagonist n=1 Tax=Mycobacterium montefiorense TaxID=154654 RepID=A0AA37PPF7_9MYCO|nr:anti-sigma factor antagonist [Mycobacterium montefiorense]GBG39678.1 anti-sigma factor antagonist [Mycobacterium montefiorense]GKU35549.1 anti-sigma factor antagonist [Mycobacterium montefiorense]GKU40554.1 anti-sigma factor antagonist [Mycobacterium montefiorense]GKU45057.1 anti-sigma factor antagonist [Mycobacterium montefiorense]GKU51207.1 anti-sigma factor antagonist [Mycobacterium montefiorense]
MNLASIESSVTRVTLSPRLVSELGDPHSTLRAATQRSGTVVIIRAGGEVDGANEDTWRCLVEEAAAVATTPGPFIVDINGLDFIGCGAFAVLAAESERCRDRGIAVRLVSCDPGVARTIQACNLGRVLPLHPTIDTALATTVA